MTNERRLERDKAIGELLKHLGTVSASSIAFLATYGAKTETISKQFLSLAVVALGLSLLLSLAAYAYSVGRFFGRDQVSQGDVSTWTFLVAFSAMAFAFGYGFIVYGFWTTS